MYDIAVFIGRFQFLHNGHCFVINEALKSAKHVIILVGSSNIPRTHRNPFTFAERKEMIQSAFPQKNITIAHLEDVTYNDEQWVTNVQRAVDEISNKLFENPSISLIGHSKDASSFYLKLFPQWYEIKVKSHSMLNATDLRKLYFSESGAIDAANIPESTVDFLKSFRNSKEYKSILEEYIYVQNYKDAWKSAPYAPIFVTVDSVVIQSGHILLVERKSFPGKGLLALPGGFVNQDETLLDAMLRELREETRLKIPIPVLKGSLIANRTFDDPHRSSRGRTITHVGLFKLADDVKLAKVRGGDDAKSAKWVPLSNVKSDSMFEDHHHIIRVMTALL